MWLKVAKVGDFVYICRTFTKIVIHMMKKIAMFFAVAAFAFVAQAADVPPCTLAIDSQEAFDGWTSVDANGDGSPYCFEYSAGGYAPYAQNKSGAANDWLISPAIALEAGESYTVTFSVHNMSTLSYDKQDFTVYAGMQADVAAMTENVFTVTGLTKSSWAVEKSGTFTATESGSWHFGLNLTSKAYNGDFAVYSIKVSKAPVYPGVVTDLTIAAAPKGELAAELTWTWPSLNDKGGTLRSITGAKIYRGTSSYSTSLVGTLEVDAEPGSQGSYTDTTVPGAGKYYYKVVAFNADGDCPTYVSTVQSEYIGMASGVTIGNVTATAAEGSETEVNLSWTGPTASGEGYFDPADVAYKITRSKDGATAVTLEDSWQGELPYVDSTIAGLGAYAYTVYTIFNGSTAWSGVKSNTVVVGGAATLPYSNSFSSSGDIALFTLFHGPECTRDWGVSSSALDFWGGTVADAWAVTPKFRLEPGKAYKVSFTARVSRAASPKNLAVAVGTAPTAEALTEVIFDENIASALSTAKEAMFSVPSAGDYYVAFHCYGTTDYNDLYVDDLLIEEVATAPLGVTDAKAEAAPMGELKVGLSWTNPLKSTAGQELTVIDKVVIARGGEVLETQTDVEPGSAGAFADVVDAPGVYTYSITAYLNDNESETVEATTAWVGYDVPKAPEKVTVSLGDDGERIVEFALVTEGEHGGYVDLDALRYEVKRNDLVLTSDQTDSPYVDSEVIAELALYTYSVAAVNGDYAGAATVSAPVTLGDALALPYTADFSTAEAFDLWTLGSWTYNKSKSALENSKSNSWAFTPPLAMKTGECKVTFKATCFNTRYEEDMEIYLTAATVAPMAEDDDNAVAAPVKVGELHVASVSFPNATEFTFPVERTGNYYLSVGQQSNNMYLYLSEFSVEQTVDNSTGIDAVEADTTHGSVRYFNLQGMEIVRPAKGQIVIVSRDGRTSKQIFK